MPIVDETLVGPPVELSNELTFDDIVDDEFDIDDELS